MTTAARDLEAAAQLKAEGNTLFQAKDFVGAYEKYTQAISHDGENAILYANRSACSLALGRRLDAADDADKATKLDPGYAKAWTRVAAANTGSPNTNPHAMSALQTALKVLSKDSTPAGQRLRAECTILLEGIARKEAELEKEAIARARPLQEMAGIPDDKLPWKLAATLLPTLKSEGKWNSSAWLITYAREQWETGMNILRRLEVTPGPAAECKFLAGQPVCIEHLSNALLADSRVFKFMRADFSDAIGKYPYQLRLELMHWGGWISGGPQRVIREATERYNQGGLDAVRDGLAVTVRGWLVSGWIEEFYLGALEHALDYYTAALEVLEWGMETWKNEDVQERGLIFQEAIVRAVKILRLRAFTQAYKADPGPNSKYPLREVLVGSNELVEELQKERKEPLGEEEYSLFMGFVRYQLAQAYTLRAFFFHHTAVNARRAARSEITQEVEDTHMIAAGEYLNAVEVYPEDDELHAWCYYHAYTNSFEVARPVQDILMMLHFLHEAIPKMKTIWEVPLETSISEREGRFRSALACREDLVANVQQGNLTLDLPIMRKPEGY
ncbi:hypothetical protein OH77DRAFT_1420503 [Trametes cingulata]|nr:hypothetical protein OH77DRAFT_1420503 [Trametes cingulata]